MRVFKIFLMVLSFLFVIGLIGYLIIISTFDLFPTEQIKLAEFFDKRNDDYYSLYAFQGNSTVSNNLKLYQLKNDSKQLVDVLETFTFYDKKKKVFSVNDSTIMLILINVEGEQDTIKVNLNSQNSTLRMW